VLDGLVRARELCEVMSGHLRLDLDRVEHLSVVNTNDGTDHLRDDNHVTQMGFDDGWFLVWLGFFFGLAEFFDQAHGSSFETTLEAPAGAGVYEFYELFVAEVKELIEFDTAKRECAECPLLLEVGSYLRIGRR